MTLRVLSPVAGTVLALKDVPDPVFAEALVGPGVAVDPAPDATEVRSPVAGRIVKLHPHAFVVTTGDGHAVLVHLGLDTVQLKGEGFTLHAAEQDEVEAGQPLVTWSPADVAAGGRSPVVPVIAMEAAADALEAAAPGTRVEPGDELLTWA